MQKSGVEFPFSTSHNTYITKGRDDKSYAWQTYNVNDQNANVAVGDLVCYARDSDVNVPLSEIYTYKSQDRPGSLTHCDCVREVPAGANGVALKAYTYGGNVSNTVKQTPITLTEGGLIDPSSNTTSKKYICVIKYQPKGAEVATTGGNGTFDPNATGTFTSVIKYPVLFQKLLSHESHTYDDHNWYEGGTLKGYLADVNKTRYGGLTKPLSQYTIGEVIQFQSHDESGVGRLHATGRFQIIKTTLIGNLKEAGLTNSDLYNPENQDKLAMSILHPSVKNYIEKKVDDTQENLNQAAYTIATTWSSVGVPYPTTRKVKNKDGTTKIVQVAYDASYYGDNGVDKAAVKTADIQEILKYYRNGTALASSATATTNSKNVVIGDSLAKGIDPIYPAISRISSPKILDTIGWKIGDLITALKGTNTTFPDVKNLILSIGANGLWTLSGGNAKELELIGLIREKFPNANKYIINGNYGWEPYLNVTTTNTAPYWINRLIIILMFLKIADLRLWVMFHYVPYTLVKVMRYLPR